MISGWRGGPVRTLRAAVLALAGGACVLLPALPSAAAVTSPEPSWGSAWSWRTGSAGLPAACSALDGTRGGIRFSPSRVGFAGGRLRIAPTATRDGGAGIACRTGTPGYARVVLRARLPGTPGVVTRIGLSAAPAGGDGSGCCGLAVPGAGTASVTSGSGEDVEVVGLRGTAAGSLHVFTLTWAPTTFTVAVDGHEVRRERRPGGAGAMRWLTIGTTTTARAPRAEPLVVTALTVETPRAPSRTGTLAALPALVDAATAAPRPVGPAPAVVAPAPPAGPLPGQVGSEVDGRLPDAVAALQTTTLTGPWLLAGTCAGVGVLLGVLRAAITARRRPLAGT